MADPPLVALLLSPSLELSAATLYTLNLASALTDAGHAIEVLSPGGALEPIFRDRQLSLTVSPRLTTPILGYFAERALLRGYRERGVKVIHAQSSLAVRLGVRFAQALSIPLVTSVHRFAADDTSAVDWSLVSRILVVSDALRENVVNRRRAPRDRVAVLPSGVALDYEPRPAFAHGGAPVIGTLGDREKIEAQETFLRTARAVLDEVPDAEFLIIGQGASRDRLRRLIDELGLRRSVTFTPIMDQKKALPVMDVCVLPSTEEGPGQVILEAMAAARPVVTIGKGSAFTAVRDEETGLLVEDDDPRSLAEAVKRLLKDRDLARQLGLNGRRRVATDYPVSRMVEGTLEVYEGAAAKAR